MRRGAASLPASLLVVEDEAFAETAFKTVIFESKAVSVGKRAFSGNTALQDAYLPASVQFIGAEAFPAGLTIHGKAESFSREWAEANAFLFRSEDIWNPWALVQTIHMEFVLLLICATIYPDLESFVSLCRRVWSHIRSMRPQDRPELNPIDYRFP